MKPSNSVKSYLAKANNTVIFANYTQIRPKKINFKPLIITITTLISLSLASSQLFADNLSSPTFEIKMGTINITGGSKSSASYNLSDTVGQTAQGEFNSAGFTIKAGFQYVRDPFPFAFTISNIELDYGSLVPGTPSTLTNTLYITNGSAYGYTVKVIEDHPLKHSVSVDTIPDTTCDIASPCTITDATPWTVNTRYGFGYNVAGADADTDFVDSTYFRPFPIQGTDQPSLVMSKASPVASSSATVTYKINVSGNQAAGTYQNGIQYIAIPAF